MVGQHKKGFRIGTLFLAILAVILGVQLFLAGFLGELVNRGSSDRNNYRIDKTL